ncbi:MAG: electron transfer flavoprotein subunit beta/FixA family protein [bacterium]|nr:electron transfer flavoprotein subunit beta/FixA family protein [bacterium]
MKIAVLIKYCPDSEAAINVVSGKLDTSSAKFSVSPYDEYACEEALKIIESQGSGEAVVFNVGPEKNGKGLRDELARGADRAVHIVTEKEITCPEFTSRLLAAALKQENPDLILCGWKGIDYDLGITGTKVAEKLGIPHVMVVSKLTIADGKAICTRQVDSGDEIIEVPLPAVIGAQKGLNEPRYPSLKGIMKAKKKPASQITPAQLGVEEPTGKAMYTGFTFPPSKSAGKKFEGPESVVEVVRLLREEAKVI